MSTDRIFTTHYVRREIALGDMWQVELEDKRSFKLAVPGCIESVPSMTSYVGRAVFSKEVMFGGSARLVFRGVSHTARVFLDGRLLGSHYGAYGSFSFVLKDIPYGRHVIGVETDNSLSGASALHVSNDYYNYNGITRPVLLEQLNKAYIKYVHFTPHRENGIWRARLSASVENVSDTAESLKLRVSIAGTEAEFAETELKAGESRIISAEAEFADAADYMPSSPVLYEMQAELMCGGQVIDDLIDRVGFKEIRVEGRDVYFNDEKIKLKGFNRHEEYAEFGCAVPLAAMCRDIEIIKDTGANCVRTCHYPNDERWLDLCDENGLFVWEEAHARGLSEEQMRNPAFDWQSALTTEEMITEHYNHPSIFVWGLLNECASHTEYGRECYKRQIAQIRSLDSSRPVTYASCHPWKDICLDLVDIVSFNIYPGWYFDEDVAGYLKRVRDWVETTEGAGKPFIISETGAGAIYGFRSTTKAKWSEERQADILKEQLTAVMADAECMGVIIWQYCDCRVDEGWFAVRPKSENNKGVVDIYRREKLAYGTVKAIFSKNK